MESLAGGKFYLLSFYSRLEAEGFVFLLVIHSGGKAKRLD